MLIVVITIGSLNCRIWLYRCVIMCYTIFISWRRVHSFVLFSLVSCSCADHCIECRAWKPSTVPTRLRLRCLLNFVWESLELFRNFWKFRLSKSFYLVLVRSNEMRLGVWYQVVRATGGSGGMLKMADRQKGVVKIGITVWMGYVGCERWWMYLAWFCSRKTMV